MGIWNRGCCISGPADLGVRGGVGGCPPPDGEFEFPSKAEDRSPGGKEPIGPNMLLDVGESDEVGGEESFSGKENCKGSLPQSVSKKNVKSNNPDIVELPISNYKLLQRRMRR